MGAIDIDRPSFMDEEALNIFGNSVDQFLKTYAGPTQMASWRETGSSNWISRAKTPRSARTQSDHAW